MANTGKADAIADLREHGYDYAAAKLAKMTAGIHSVDYATSYRDGTYNAGLGAGHVWTNMNCPAYRSQRGLDCDCASGKPTRELGK